MTNDSTSDINDNWTCWREIVFLQSLTTRFLRGKFITGKFNPPWITGDILNVLKKKETVRRKLRRTIGTCADKIMVKYKSLRNTAKKLIKNSREKCFASMSKSLYSNPKRFLSFFKTTTKSCRIPQQVSTTNGTNSSRTSSRNAQETANLFNYYFNSMFLKESDENYHPVPPVSNESITEIILKQCEVRNALNNLNPNKAFGPDNIQCTHTFIERMCF